MGNIGFIGTAPERKPFGSQLAATVGSIANTIQQSKGLQMGIGQTMLENKMKMQEMENVQTQLKMQQDEINIKKKSLAQDMQSLETTTKTSELKELMGAFNNAINAGDISVAKKVGDRLKERHGLDMYDELIQGVQRKTAKTLEASLGEKYMQGGTLTPEEKQVTGMYIPPKNMTLKDRDELIKASLEKLPLSSVGRALEFFRPGANTPRGRERQKEIDRIKTMYEQQFGSQGSQGSQSSEEDFSFLDKFINKE